MIATKTILGIDYKEYFIVNSFILCLFINTISNYLAYSYYIKSFSAVLCFGIIYLERDKYINFRYFEEKKFILFLCSLIFLPLISLSYSNNRIFGFEKLVQLIIGLIPVILFAYHLLHSLTKDRIKAFFISISIIAIIVSFSILLFNPLLQDRSYAFKINRWSHVLIGRFLTGFCVIFGLILLFAKHKYYNIFTFLTIIILNYSIYFSAHRASTLAIILFYFLIITIQIFKKKYDKLNFTYFVGTLALTFIMIYLFPVKNKPAEERFTNLFSKYDSNFGDDSPIYARFEAFRISREIIVQNPILGVGFGGFKHAYNNRDLSLNIKYPHNIFLEYITEFGIVGLIVFLLLIWELYKGMKRYSLELIVYFTIMLWLACFSKDIPSQGMFWIGFVFLSNRDREIKESIKLL
ncbi:MAG: O-antigen ligase family protein [bacterium]